MATVYICPDCKKEYEINRYDKNAITNLVCLNCGKVFMAAKKNLKIPRRGRNVRS